MSKNCPIFSRIAAFVKGKVPPASRAAIDQAVKSVVDERGSFVRSGNFTAYSLDELARLSGKVEKKLDSPGEFIFTYSEMQGRRVDDIIYAGLDHLSRFIYPPSPREDGKMQSHGPQREKWIQSLGFQRVEAGKGKRGLFGDAFAELKAELEKEIPEVLAGTPPPTTKKALLPLVAPAKLASRTWRVNVYKLSASEEQRIADAKDLTLYLLDGWTFQRNKEGVAEGELAQYYEMACGKLIEERQKQDAA